MTNAPDPRQIIVDLCRQFYTLGWVSGTGGGISIREAGRVYIAPSGVQKERIVAGDLFVMDEQQAILSEPETPGVRPSACTPLFFNAFRLRDAGAVIHSHGVFAMLVTLLYQDAFSATKLEMLKGIRGTGFHDMLEVPIIENTAHECDLADSMADAILRFPNTHAVLVRRHGVYIWGKDWVEAKTHAECYHYLFEAAVHMHKLGFTTQGL